MKRILGLDLGTNSIGWALIKQDFDNKEGKILGLGSRIIPMSQDVLGKFDSGISISQTAERTTYRGTRRLRERHLLRRERLHRVLNILDFLPKHYALKIDFDKRKGQFIYDTEVKLNYRVNAEAKHEFIFMDSFNEMATLFKENGVEQNLPYDWTLYYLRKKALESKVTKEELAWILLNFNQKRGYYQLRGQEEEEESEKNNKSITFEVLQVSDVKDSGKRIKDTEEPLFDVYFDNGWEYDKQTTKPNDWINKQKEFIVTTSKLKDGSVKRSYKLADSEKDWIAIKKKTEQDLEKSKKHVGVYIFESLLNNPSQKINGALVKTIERKYYKSELRDILKKQSEFHEELQNRDLYNKALTELYPRNEAHQQNIKSKDFTYLFLEDIIFYQRPLKSKKSTISDCPYEFSVFEKEDEIIKRPLKAIPKSNPLFLEFRLWQFIQNLKIYKKQGTDESGKTEMDQDVTAELLTNDKAIVSLFEFLNNRKEIEQRQLLKYFSDLKLIPKQPKDDPEYFWNYVQDKKYPCNETRALFLSRLNKVVNLDAQKFLSDSIEMHLWHIIYSVKDKNEFIKALATFADRYNIDSPSFVEAFKSTPPFPNDYASYSEKAIKKLLPLMRIGSYWEEEKIDLVAKDRISDIMHRLESINFNAEKIDSVSDDAVGRALLQSFIPFKDKSSQEGLNTYQACYAVYGRHSEVSEIIQWKTPEDIEYYLNHIFKQYQLRNPIVEQVCTETLRLVKEIWKHYGNGEPNFFDEIHVELGREMQNPAEKRKQMSIRNTERENTNHRIKLILEELMQDSSIIEKPRSFSPSHQELLKIYEEGVFESQSVEDKEITKIRQSESPTKSQIKRYKIWLEQGYISPYTLRLIPLSKLFTVDYQIEHIIPQSRFFDNSFNNKIICESVINQEKGNATAAEFIKARGGETFDLGRNNKVAIVNFDTYENHCNTYFKKNRIKLRNLLADEIPTSFIARQLNDTRYISKYIKGILSNIVRDEGENQATTKRMLTVNGIITSRLKHDWGLNDKWNELIAPRFKALNEKFNTQDYGFWDKSINAFRIQTPHEISKGFSSKRIDHRHHALDALVVACITKDHVNYISSINSKRKNFRLVSKLRNTEEVNVKNPITGEVTLSNVAKSYKHPWNGFTIEAKQNLEKIIVSFKQNNRVINRTNNKYQNWEVQPDGSYKKVLKKQEGKNFSIRKQMHKETVFGKVTIKKKRRNPLSIANALENWELIVDKPIKIKAKRLMKQFDSDLKKARKHLRENPIKINNIEIKQVEVYEFVNATATRKELTDKLTQKQLDSITDSGIRKILQNHVNKFKNDKGELNFKQAFSPDGIVQMNANIIELNNGKPHKPIYKVRIYEEGGKFELGEGKNKKYVEAAKGTNLFFAIYWNEEKQKREFVTIPLNEVIAHQKQEASMTKEERTNIPIDHTKGRFLFSLSPNDLVYIPTDENIEDPSSVDFNKMTEEQVSRVYKIASFTGGRCYFTPNTLSRAIVAKEIDTTYDTKTSSFEDISIKERCWKLKTDSLGNILKVMR